MYPYTYDWPVVEETDLYRNRPPFHHPRPWGGFATGLAGGLLGGLLTGGFFRPPFYGYYPPFYGGYPYYGGYYGGLAGYPFGW